MSVSLKKQIVPLHEELPVFIHMLFVIISEGISVPENVRAITTLYLERFGFPRLSPSVRHVPP